MDLKALLGDAYKDGMTIDEINSALADKKLADLSTGNYVLKENSEATKRALEADLKKVREDLQAKMTDEEKSKADQDEKEQELQALRDKMTQLSRTSNQSKIESALTDIKGKLGIKDDDKDFQDFVSHITNDDESKNAIVSGYIGKFVKSIYDKGVADATKEAISKNSKLNNGSSQDNDKKGDLGASLAKVGKPADGAKAYNYFS